MSLSHTDDFVLFTNSYECRFLIRTTLFCKSSVWYANNTSMSYGWVLSHSYEISIVRMPYRWVSESSVWYNFGTCVCQYDELLSHPYAITTLYQYHAGGLVSPPYQIAAVRMPYGWFNRSSVWVDHMSCRWVSKSSVWDDPGTCVIKSSEWTNNSISVSDRWVCKSSVWESNSTYSIRMGQ